MYRLVVAAAAAALFATPAAAQDIAGPIAASLDQFGQGVAESMAGGQGLFVTAQGKARMPDAAGGMMTVTVEGKGKTAVEAVADRNAQLERIRSVANNFSVAIEVGETKYAIAEQPSWMDDAETAWTTDSAAAAEAAADAIEEAAVAVELVPAMGAPAETTRTVTASVQVKLSRPNETRLPAFVDALADAGVANLSDSLNGLDFGPMGPFISLLGLDAGRDPGEAVWNAATADAVSRARAQAMAIADASGRQLGPVRHVSVLLRSHDGEHALVSVAVRFGFAD
ncbi:SIMPL domain-containing protein [Brevundimonas sp. Root1279]|uniref:SIMPL domain-containing protein n=1 Tax=Brevundimonas sp. Root1279 TaxID=1736443 RepID=UPI0006FA0BA0|nr:SIMPL domain-containing protein [Brevundimonas sp. Root1279]KQW82306.1 hypothetical protein ASC65_08520 [Brevundimonas sp. Root1279]